MAKKFVDEVTVIEASDCNRWENTSERFQALEVEVQKKMYKAARDGVAGQVLVAKDGTQVEWKSVSDLGVLVTKADKVDPVGADDDIAVTGTVQDAEIMKILALAKENKQKINAILEALKTAGLMISE